MRKRSSTPDLNQTAHSIVAQATGQVPRVVPDAPAKRPRKNAAAVALGRLGGLKGGKARAAALSPRQRVAAAKRAAKARWADPEKRRS